MAVAGRGNTRMRAMVRTYAEAPARRWRPDTPELEVLDIPDDGRSTFTSKCRKCGAKYRHDLVPAQCLLCEWPMINPQTRS